MRRLLLLPLLLAGCGQRQDAPEVDAATAARARAAQDAYIAGGAAADPADERSLAAAEQDLALAEAMLDAGMPAKASEPARRAAQALRAIPASRREPLGSRFTAADRRSVAVDRRLLATIAP